MCDYFRSKGLGTNNQTSYYMFPPLKPSCTILFALFQFHIIFNFLMHTHMSEHMHICKHKCVHLDYLLSAWFSPSELSNTKSTSACDNNLSIFPSTPPTWIFIGYVHRSCAHCHNHCVLISTIEFWNTLNLKLPTTSGFNNIIFWKYPELNFNKNNVTF